MEYLIEIGYKSGNKVEFWFKSFKFTYGTERSIAYEYADPKTRMVFFGFDEIEYIHQKDVRNENS